MGPIGVMAVCLGLVGCGGSSTGSGSSPAGSSPTPDSVSSPGQFAAQLKLSGDLSTTITKGQGNCEADSKTARSLFVNPTLDISGKSYQLSIIVSPADYKGPQTYQVNGINADVQLYGDKAWSGDKGEFTVDQDSDVISGNVKADLKGAAGAGPVHIEGPWRCKRTKPAPS